MNPWKTKEMIDLAINLADTNGFRLVEHYQWPDKICLVTKGNNEHGFANDIVLESFRDWPEVVCYFAGWNKRELALAVERSKKK
jgi:hypothetical protein